MPSAEGEFPKIGNDPLYDSEANRFAGAGHFIQAGSFPPAVSGAADGTIVGSILFPGGSMADLSNLHIKMFANMPGSSRMTLRFSGAGLVNNTTIIKLGSSSDTGVTDEFFEFEAFIGSPMGQNYVLYKNYNTAQGVVTTERSTLGVGGLPGGSPYIFQFETVSDAPNLGGSLIGSLTVHGFIAQVEGRGF